MAKRKNRLSPIDHERRQIENLKVLDPIATPPEALPLSNALIDIAIEALSEVYELEAGEPPQMERLTELINKVSELPRLLAME